MAGYWTRVAFAFRTFFSILDYGRIPGDVSDALEPRVEAQPAEAPPPSDPGLRAAQILGLLQRDGRLVDFLMEDLAAYQDAQIGAAVRDVHAGCRGVLSRYLTLAPVLDDPEGADVIVPHGFDPARIKVVGNVAGQPPFKGVLRHRGWEATRLDLPPLPPAAAVLAPAEVEVA